MKPLIAVLMGARLCVTDSRIRSFCTTPWLFGILIYAAMMITLIYFYTDIIALIPIKPDSILGIVLFYISAITVTLGIGVGGMILTSLVVLLMSGYYQYRIAATVLADYKILPPTESAFIAELKKSVTREVLRFALILPFLAVSFLLSAVPFLGILALALGAWLTAFPFFDITLEICGLSATQSITFCRSRYLLLIVFGLTLLPFWIIPFAPVFLTPFASAGVAWLIATNASFLPMFQSPENCVNN